MLDVSGKLKCCGRNSEEKKVVRAAQHNRYTGCPAEGEGLPRDRAACMGSVGMV